MTDAECAEILSEFRKLNLGPELSAALDHAIGRLGRLKIGEQHPEFPIGSRAIDLAMA